MSLSEDYYLIHLEHTVLEVLMPMSDSLRGTLEELRAQERKTLDELNSLRFTIRNLERLGGIESSESSNIDNMPENAPPAKEATVAASSGTGGKATIRPDEFFGLTHAEAARRYLKKIGHAVPFAELVEVLRKGGCKLTSTDPERVLWISLIKNSKDFVPPQKGFVGLREFYPAGARAANEKTKIKKKRKKGKKKAKKKDRAASDGKAAEQPDKPKEVGNAVQEFMSDKKPHSPEEVAEAVSKKLGRQIKVIAVRGSLNNKRHFEKADGKFRLVT
jgi:hypothetical protein